VGDEHWVRLSGSGAIAEVVDDNLYLAMSVRNSGSGVAVIHGWHLVLQELQRITRTKPEEFRRQLRDLYVAGDDVGFWQAAIRDRDDPEYAALLEALRAPRVFAIELLYGDHEGGQRAIGRFAMAPVKGDGVALLRDPALEPGPPRPPLIGHRGMAQPSVIELTAAAGGIDA
jgi:hypothetical protein